MRQKTDLASIKLSRSFVMWLKIEAAKAGKPMYEFLENHFPEATKSKPRKSL